MLNDGRREDGMDRFFVEDPDMFRSSLMLLIVSLRGRVNRKTNKFDWFEPV